jgi:hypothetical protein
MKSKLFDTDYVLIKNGEPVEDLDIIYSLGTIHCDAYQITKNWVKEDEQLVSMTKLPKELQERYLDYIENNS